MKKFLSSVTLLLFVVAVNAQSEKYTKAMEANVATIDSLHTAQAWTDMANTFQRIGDAEKTQWLPYYYAALGNVMTGYMEGAATGGTAGADKIDPLANKAEEMLNKAEALNKDNSDIYCVKKMIATLRMMADPMNRYMTYGPQAAEALQKAKSLNPENPRVYLLEGQDKFYTPEQYGGSKTEAKTLFETSMKKYESVKLESAIHPQWGKSQVMFFLAQLK
jgi:tetratricopeptide (TPR) repeat protein